MRGAALVLVRDHSRRRPVEQGEETCPFDQQWDASASGDTQRRQVLLNAKLHQHDPYHIEVGSISADVFRVPDVCEETINECQVQVPTDTVNQAVMENDCDDLEWIAIECVSNAKADR